jgi:hypothetical protein
LQTIRNKGSGMFNQKIMRLSALLFVSAVLIGSGIRTHAQDENEKNLASIKTYLLTKTTTLKTSTEALKAASDAYYTLAEAEKFDYTPLWKNQAKAVSTALESAKSAWIEASPLYEQMEGIVAGVPSLAEYDVILDAGTSGEEPDSAVPFDLKLPDGKVLEKPGNLFGLLEATLWGTRAEFITPIKADLDGDGKQEFGEVLPDANMLKGAADLMDQYTTDLAKAAEAWEPTDSDAFTALVVMIPTMSEYFESWKLSRFVAGETSTQSEFVVISRLSDIQDILSGLETVYTGVSPKIAALSPAQDQQIAKGLQDLKAYVVDLYEQEKSGKHFTAEEADLFGSEAQKRAEAIVGQITQVAAQLDIKLAE